MALLFACGKAGDWKLGPASRSGTRLTADPQHWLGKWGGKMTACETAARTLPDTIVDLDLRYLGRKLLDDDACEAERATASGCGMRSASNGLCTNTGSSWQMLWHPEAFLVPSEDIDEVWHTHVLNTAR